MAFPGVQTAPISIWGKTASGLDSPIAVTNPVQATGALTFSGNAVAGQYFTIGDRRYTWTSAVNVQTPNLVFVGVNAAASIVNAAAAINHSSGDGSLYSYNTVANTQVTAVATSSTVLTITAIGQGADGNGIATTSNTANATWGSTATSGGLAGALIVSTPTPSGTPVVGVQEVDTAANKTGDYTIPAGSLSFLINPSSDFVGTIAGQTWTGSAGAGPNIGAFSRTAQPGNTLPAYAVTRSAGSYLVIEGRPA